MSKRATQDRLHKSAREIAKSGRHIGWWHVAQELAERGEPLAVHILEQEPIKGEINRICQAAIDHSRPRGWCP